jgi:hypothetical protein
VHTMCSTGLLHSTQRQGVIEDRDEMLGMLCPGCVPCCCASVWISWERRSLHSCCKLIASVPACMPLQGVAVRQWKTPSCTPHSRTVVPASLH